MEQVYWLSPPTESGTDTRMLLYRYGNFAYAGSVLTEPVRGLEYLPGVLTGIQAVQGQVPYLCEVGALPGDSPYAASLLSLQRALDLVHRELDQHTERLAALAAQPGNEWIDSEDSAIYFEIEAVPGYTCNSSEVIFAKSYRGELMLTLIWYAPHGCFYVTLSPSSGEEQTLVDTLFPQIYGKRRGVTLHEYKATPAQYDSRLERAYSKACGRSVGQRPSAAAAGGAAAGGGKEAEEEEEVEEGAGEEGEGPLPPPSHLADPSRIFQRISIWEGSGEVPDPDVIKARDLEEGLGGKEGEEGEGEEEAEGKEGERCAEGAVTDVSGGEGYTQVYLVMAPSPTAPRTPVQLGEEGGALGGGSASASTPGLTAFLVPRAVLFRFGNWVYGGEADFPVEQLHLGDVPYVLPALQKQQGRLEYISDAKAMPAGYGLTPTLQQFMAAVAILKAEMEDSQTELAQLGSSPANSWIDEESAASFFELSFRAGSIEGAPASASAPGTGLAGAEVIAAKIYLFGGTGLVLHVVWFRTSLYCVLADNTEDLPLLDVAFPDVTARNRVVQVREYKNSTAEKLRDSFPGAPLVKCLRVWEGRRKGAFPELEAGGGKAGGAGAASAAAEGKPSAAAGGGAVEAKAAAAVSAGSAGASAAGAVATPAASATPAAASSAATATGPALTSSLEIDGDLYDMGGVTAKAPGGSSSSSSSSSATAAGGGAGQSSASASAASASGSAVAKPQAASQIVQGVAKAPHFVAPMAAGGSGSSSSSAAGGSIMGMASKLIMVGGKEDESAPWDATGKPKAV